MRRDLEGKKDVYQEIAEKYKDYIAKGVFRGGEKLPSVRDAACTLGVNPNTVAKAYALLEREGYVVTLPKKGAYVRGNDTDGDSDPRKDLIRALKNEGCDKETLIKWIEEVYEND